MEDWIGLDWLRLGNWATGYPFAPLKPSGASESCSAPVTQDGFRKGEPGSRPCDKRVGVNFIGFKVVLLNQGLSQGCNWERPPFPPRSDGHLPFLGFPLQGPAIFSQAFSGLVVWIRTGNSGSWCIDYCFPRLEIRVLGALFLFLFFLTSNSGSCRG